MLQLFVTLSHTGFAYNVLLTWDEYYTYMEPTPCEMAVKINVAFNLFFPFRRAFSRLLPRV